MKLLFSRTDTHDLAMPAMETPGSGGFDLPLYAPNGPLSLWEGAQLLVRTGWAVAIPDGYVGLIRPRSGISVRFGLDVGAGVIDSDYRGEIRVLLRRVVREGCSARPLDLAQGDRIAQMVVVPYLICDVSEASDLSETERGERGFGSTGK